MYKFLLLAFVAQILGSQALSSTDYQTAYDQLDDWFDNNSGYIPLAVRLTFHDCVGGCDGCINTDNDSNAGLEEVLELFETEYDSDAIQATGMSRADFWTIASYVAITKGIRSANIRDGCTFRDAYCLYDVPDFEGESEWGRVDCNTEDYTTTDEHTFPDANFASEESTTYFNTTFGLNEQETVALLGAHTLGGAAPTASGYAGTWVEGEISVVNEKFFDLMLDDTVEWTNREVRNSGKWQFDGADASDESVGFMLNSDFALLYDLELDSDNVAQCSVNLDDANLCSESPTASYVRAYEGQTQTWVDDFWVALKKMQAAGSASLSAMT